MNREQQLQSIGLTEKELAELLMEDAIQQEALISAPDPADELDRTLL